MNSLIPIKEGIFGLALAFGLAGGGLVMLLNDLHTTGPVKNTATVDELLRDQNPGQISYLSFPITEHFQNQLESLRKSIPVSGER